MRNLRNKLFIASHLGLGDHILCNGLYREVTKKYDTCVIPIRKSNSRAMSHMVGDEKKIRLIALPDEYAFSMVISMRNYLQANGYDVLNLGYFGEEFLTSGDVRFDLNFYNQAGLPFSLRWSSFSFERNLDRENELFDLLGCANGDYLFLHEDVSRGYTIDRQQIDSKLRIIQPDPTKSQFSFFDYQRVIEGASEIHCIESSFAALIESVGSTSPKFAHRYSRPQASGDYGHEFTYSLDWHILR